MHFKLRKIEYLEQPELLSFGWGVKGFKPKTTIYYTLILNDEEYYNHITCEGFVNREEAIGKIKELIYSENDKNT